MIFFYIFRLGKQLVVMPFLLNLNLAILYLLKIGPSFVGPAPSQFSKYQKFIQGYSFW